MMWGQARASSGVMGVDTHTIAGVRACPTFAPDRSSPTIQPTPHYAEALRYGVNRGPSTGHFRMGCDPTAVPDRQKAPAIYDRVGNHLSSARRLAIV